MRVAKMAVGLAVMLAACGGEKKAEEMPAAEQAAPAAEAPAAEAAAPAATGATIDVNMELEGTTYKYSPAEITAKVGDVIKFHNKSGGPHNVAFDPAAIPSGSESAIDAALGANKMGPLTGALILEADAIFELSTAGMPTGEYHFFCTPHQALGMKGKLTLQ